MLLISKDESQTRMCQDTSTFPTDIYNVLRPVKRREGVHTHNAQSVTSKQVFRFCPSSSKAAQSVPQHPEADFLCDALHNNGGLHAASCAPSATVVTSATEAEGAAGETEQRLTEAKGETEQRLAPCSLPQLPAGRSSSASHAAKRRAADTCPEGTGRETAKSQRLGKALDIKLPNKPTNPSGK